MIYTTTIRNAINLLVDELSNEKDSFGYPCFIEAYSVAEKMDSELKTIIALLYGVCERRGFDVLQKLKLNKDIISAMEYLVYDKKMSYDNYIKKLTNNNNALDVMISFLYYRINYVKANDHNYKYTSQIEKNEDYLKYLLDYKMHQKRDVYKDSIIGLVVGDALGVPLETTPRVNLQMNPINDMVGYRTHMMPEGTWSDDTSMTLAELDSIYEKKEIDYYDIMDKFVNWCKNNDYTSTGVFFDIGNTTKKALTNYSIGKKPTECGCNDFNDNGNGSLMRIIPFIIYSIENELNEDDEVKLINDSSSITHAHEISKLGCKIYCDFIKSLYNGKNIEESFEYIMNKNYSKYYSNDSIKRYDRILNGSIRNASEKDIISHGYIVHTLEASLWSLYNSSDYSSAVLRAINLGGDTDTIGAITGSLAGAFYGMIPTKWVNKVSNIELVDYLYENFIKSVQNKKANNKTK